MTSAAYRNRLSMRCSILVMNCQGKIYLIIMQIVLSSPVENDIQNKKKIGFKILFSTKITKKKVLVLCTYAHTQR